MSQLQDLARRVDRLLLRHEELQRTNALLEQRVRDLESECRQLEARLDAARSRVNTLLERIPAENGTDEGSPAFPPISKGQV